MQSFYSKFEPISLPLHGVRLPKIEIPEADYKRVGVPNTVSNLEFLTALCRQGYKEKVEKGIINKERAKEYADQIKHELSILDELGFVDYILLIHDVINFCNKNDIPVGRGRGSAASSLVLYLSKVTGIDPVEGKLFFERFISKARAKSKIVDGITYIDGSMAPDVDLDICHERRHEVVTYLENKYKGNFCKLPTYSTLQSKILIKECGKIVEELSEDKMRDVSASIPSLFGRVHELEKAYTESAKFKEFCDAHPKVYRFARKLRKLIKNKGSHASAYLVSYYPLEDFMPCEQSADGEIIASFDMQYAQIESIKLDLLGLQGVTLADKVCKSVGIDPDEFDVNNYDSIYKHLQDLKTSYGLFQISGDCNVRVTQKIKPRNLNALAAVVALARPGALALVDDYVKDVSGDIEDPVIREILKDDHGCLTYQEAIMAVLSQAYGFPKEDGEILRKIIGKKLNDKVDEWKEKIYAAGKEKGISDKVTDWFWSTVKASADYSFNKSLLGSTEVITKKGVKEIKNIISGDWVLAFDVANRWDHWVKVKDTFTHRALLHRVHMENGSSVGCSMEHKFLCGNSEMAPLKEIILGEYDIVTANEDTTTKVKTINPIGVMDAYDLEVDHPDHNFYANGLVTSNSHALSYATLSALTVYLKFNFPQHFFVECLKMAQYKQDSLEEISMIQQELVQFGIKLLPPDLIKSKLQFSIEGENIRFGLSAIKGISNKSIGNVRDFVKTETANKFEAFQAARQAGLNIGVLSAFIQAGALDSIDDNRPRMVLESQLWNLLTIKERIYCLENGALHKWNLLEMIKNITDWTDDKGKKVARATRLGTIKKKYTKYKEIYLLNKKSPDFAAYVYEKKLLGYSYSQSLKKIFSGEMGIDLMSIAEIAEEAENLSVECIAEVVEAKMGTSKNGNKYLKIICRDESGSFNFMILGDKLAQYLFQHKAPSEEGFIYIKGRKGADIVWIDRMTVLDSRVFMKLSDLRDVEVKEENILETVEKPK